MKSLENICLKIPQDIISVIIPVYNVEKYIAKCVESIINQSYKELEIIIIDDGSTDKSGIICDEYARIDNRIQIIHTTNNGLSSARNTGIDLSTGSLIAFIDGDDWLEHSALETMLMTMKSSNADVVTAGYFCEYMDKTITDNIKITESQLYETPNVIPAYINSIFSTVVWNKLYRKSCFSEIRFPCGHNYEDGYIMWRLMKKIEIKKGKVYTLNSPLVHHRVRKTSITHIKSLSNMTDCWNANFEKYLGMPEYKNQNLIGCYMAIGHMWLHYFGLPKKEKKNAESLISEMHNFSQINRPVILKSKVALNVKMACFFSGSTSFFTFLLCFLVGRARILYSNFCYKKFE